MNIAKTVVKRAGRSERLFRAVLAAAMFLMLSITVVDVIGRYQFGKPVYGSYELMEFLLAIAAFAALPLATIRREHVTINLFAVLFARSRTLNAFKNFLVDLATAAVFFLVGWIMWIQANDLDQFGVLTAIFRLPLYLVAYFVSASLYLTAVLTLHIGTRDLLTALRGETRQNKPQGRS